MIVKSKFKPAWWAKNRHMQTIWGAIFRQLPELPALKRERVELADGDFIDLDIFARPESATVLILHGLEGDINSHYMRGIVKQLSNNGYQVIVKYFRGCSGESNRLPRSYHSGVSDDLEAIMQALQQSGITVNYLLGFSLGGNVVLKWLGENYQHHAVAAAVAVSVPMLLNECANSIDVGFSKVYSNHLLSSLKRKTLEKKSRFAKEIELTPQQINKLNSFWSFDHQVTAPLHGFATADEYYQNASSQQFLKRIAIPTLIIHAQDDPFMNPKVIPNQQQLSPTVKLELAEAGGHVGFVGGPWPWQAEYYLEHRIPEFLAQFPSVS